MLQKRYKNDIHLKMVVSWKLNYVRMREDRLV